MTAGINAADVWEEGAANILLEEKLKKRGTAMIRDEIYNRAEAVMENPPLAALTGNYIAIFTMLILQEILVQLTVNPLTNFNNIIAVSTTIANLNSSIKSVQ